MDKIIEPCAPVVGVQLGQKAATCDLQIGPRYHTLWIEVVAKGAAGKTLVLTDVLGLLSLKINGRVQRQHLASELDAIQTDYGPAYAANTYKMVNGLPTVAALANADTGMFVLGIHLAEPWRKSYAATEAMAWYTSWQDGSVVPTFQLEIECPNTGNVDATAPYTISVYAEKDFAVGPVDGNKKPVQLITRWERTSKPYTGAGDLYIIDMPKRHVLEQVTIFGQTNDNVTACKVKVDNRILRDVTKVRNDQTLIGREWNEANLSVDRFHLAFDYSDLPTDGLVLEGVKDFQVIPTLGAAAAANKMLTLISQVYGPID
jgi:hypothetical protein